MTRPIPPALLVSLIAFGAITLVQLVIGVASRYAPVLLAVLLNIILMVGLYRGARWAFLRTRVECRRSGDGRVRSDDW